MHRVFGDSPVPRYAQLADLFRQRIARGLWTPGTQLPSLNDLTREFSVARVTIRQAVSLLERDGLVSAEQGRGTFVTARPATDRRLRVDTTLKDLVEMYRGDKPQLLTISEASAVPPLTEADGLPAPKYFHMRRVHSRDGLPYCVISIYLDERVFRRAPKRFRREVVIPVLADLGVDIARARQTLTIGTADVEVAGRIKIPVNSPVGEVRRVFNAPDGTVMYLAEVIYRGDFIRVDMDLRPK
ncbi:MAG: GntR family transcriptional regulator [Alphaproteobacteria bacterium]|nr:GntR family transcriptional regulator [Alphaproteobacteria bacterium]